MSAVAKRWYAAVAALETCVLCNTYGVQVAHSNQDRGMGEKAKPWLTAALCPSCHHEIDNGRDLPQDERRRLMARAIVRTHDRLIESGVLVLK